MTSRQEGAFRKRPLSVLGITEVEERIYRWLLSHPKGCESEIAEEVSLEAHQVRRIMADLEAKGLVTRTKEHPPRYVPASPDMAMEALIIQRQQELQDARGVIRELHEQSRTAQSADEQERVVEMITERDAVRQVFERIHRMAQSEVLSLVRLPIFVTRLDVPAEQDEHEQQSAIGRGVSYRTIIDSEFLAAPLAVNRIRDEKKSGEDIRVIPRLPFKMILSDRRYALLPMDMRQPDGPTLLVRSLALIDALYALFEFIWERATPVSFAQPGEMDVDNHQIWIPEGGEELLSLLAAGINDKRIAHELGMSRSTYGRRISEIMKALNAATRFQLGWLAAKHTSSSADKHQENSEQSLFHKRGDREGVTRE